MTHPRQCSRYRFVRGAQGFTLIELLTVIAILGVISALAFPSFQAMTNTNRLASHANEFMASLQFARMESLRRNVRTTVCRSSNGTSCTTGTTWPGWIVYADGDRDKALSAGEIVRAGTVKAPVQVVNSAGITNNSITFSPDGMARSGGALLNATIRVCVQTNKPVSNARDVTIASGSRIAVDSANAGITCTSP